MRNLASWIRPKDQKWFGPIFVKHRNVRVWNARHRDVPMDEMHGLLLTGGSDISKKFLHQPVPDSAVLDKDVDPVRDRWEFEALHHALARGLPVLAICKGLQVFNVALGGTLLLDIRGHNLRSMKDRNVQPLRFGRRVTHHFPKVNSAHHQAIDRLAGGCEVEAWCKTDDIIEQIRLRKYPYGFAVQYHPERSRTYAPLFQRFVNAMKS